MKTNSFGLALTSDAYRLKKLKSVWVSLIIMFVAVFLTFAIYLIGMKMLDNMSPEDAVDKDATVSFLGTIITSMLYNPSSVTFIEFLIAIVACIFIGKDFSLGYITLTTARGTKRANTYFSKWLSLVCLFFFYLCFAQLISGIFYAISGSPGGFTSAKFGILMRNFGLQFLAGVASVSVFVMINFLCRSTGTSIAICIAAYLLLSVIVNVISTVILANDTTGKKLDWTIFLPLQQMNIASTADKLSSVQIVAATVMPIAYTAISTVIGYFTFKNRDIK